MKFAFFKYLYISRNLKQLLIFLSNLKKLYYKKSNKKL